MRTVFQFIGGGIRVSTAQSIFTNRLIQSIPIYVSDVTTEQILQIGAYDLSSALDDAQLLGVLRSYLIGLRAAWTFSIAFSGVTFLLSLLVGWKSLKARGKDSVVFDKVLSIRIDY
jgi:MFS transporter, DHA2 family, glioxin efflux transporter